MAAWTVVPSLLSLRAEFNAIAPNRDKGADGTIGDTNHTSASDHTPDEDSSILRDHDPDSKNEVHALDIDSSGPWPSGRSFGSIVAAVIAGERSKWLSATDRCRLKYVIFNRKIYSQSSDFEPRDYTGSDPHTNHAHFSARYDTPAENDTRPWGVVTSTPEKDDDMTPAEMTAWANSTAGRAALREAAVDALEARRPYYLQRISNLGWSDLSVDGKLDYIIEALVATAQVDADQDGDVESATVQARLGRIETMLNEIKAALAGS